MGSISSPSPVLLILAAFSRHGAALDWARAQAEAAWGPVALESARFRFDATDYYEASMGAEISKVFYAFERLIDPGDIVAIKLRANEIEAEFAADVPDGPPRPVNLDPGYVTEGKLVLVSTKDFAHRVYLGGGIYAEVTLQYAHGRWVAGRQTFPDYA